MPKSVIIKFILERTAFLIKFAPQTTYLRKLYKIKDMVIQRWQSVLLLAAAVMMGIFTFCSIGQVQTPDYTFNFMSLGFFQEGEPTGGSEYQTYSSWYLFVMSLTSCILLLIDIFLYRNLPLQKRICLVSILFMVATGATACGLGYGTVPQGEIGWSTVICAPVIGIIAAILAWQRMQKDHNMLKSVDRIR